MVYTLELTHPSTHRRPTSASPDAEPPTRARQRDSSPIARATRPRCAQSASTPSRRSGHRQIGTAHLAALQAGLVAGRGSRCWTSAVGGVIPRVVRIAIVGAGRIGGKRRPVVVTGRARRGGFLVGAPPRV